MSESESTNVEMLSKYSLESKETSMWNDAPTPLRWYYRIVIVLLVAVFVWVKVY